MSNASKELATLIERFQARAEALSMQFEVEVTAIAWRLAAEKLNDEMSSVTVDGSLSWKGRPARKTEMIVRAPHINVKKMISGSGKLKPAKNGVSNAQKILNVLGKDGAMAMSELSKRIPGPSRATLRGLLSKMKSEEKVRKDSLSMWTVTTRTRSVSVTKKK